MRILIIVATNKIDFITIVKLSKKSKKSKAKKLQYKLLVNKSKLNTRIKTLNFPVKIVKDCLY